MHGRIESATAVFDRGGVVAAKACLAAALTLLACGPPLGCSHDEHGKASHFEHDHEVAEHWPSDLGDLAEKLRGRLREDADDATRHEVEDLVSWVGEVAADTDLSEADWVPLYERSEAITAELKRAGDNWSAELIAEIESLCVLIDASAAKLSPTDNEVEVNES
jgi:hypothetical protein